MSKFLRPALLASALVLSGCLKSATAVVVDETGGGDASVVLALDPALAAELAIEADGLVAGQLAALDETELCTQFRQLALPSSLPDSATVTDYDVDGLCGHQIDFTFTDGEELGQVLDQATGGQAGSLDTFVLAPEGDDWIFSAPLGGLTSSVNTAASALPPELVETALASADVTYDLTMPGTAVEGANNADQVDGGRFQWVIDASNPPETLSARTTAAGGSGGDGSNLLALGLIGAGAVAILGLGTVVIRRLTGS